MTKTATTKALQRLLPPTIKMVDCRQYRAVLTEKGCRANCELAERAYRRVQQEMHQPGACIERVDRLLYKGLDRLMHCGKCERGPDVDIEMVIKVIEDAVKEITKYLEEEMDWRRGDPDFTKERYDARQKRFREKNKERRKVYMMEWRKRRKEMAALTV